MIWRSSQIPPSVVLVYGAFENKSSLEASEDSSHENPTESISRVIDGVAGQRACCGIEPGRKPAERDID
jgi:hypothetical protein